MQALQIYEVKVISYCIEMDLNRRHRSAAMTGEIPVSQTFSTLLMTEQTVLWPPVRAGVKLGFMDHLGMAFTHPPRAVSIPHC